MKTAILHSKETFAWIERSATYPEEFHPSERYPEYRLSQLSEENRVYDMVRRLLYSMGLDAARFGTAGWNPLGCVIKPGDTVVVKPNMVRHFNPVEPDIKAVVTHGSIIRAIADYCFIALDGRGSLIIADAPLQSTDFDAVARYTRLAELTDIYIKEKQFHIEVIDLRQVMCRPDSIIEKIDACGDPKGYSVVDLANHSSHSDRAIDWDRYRVTGYNPALMRNFHNDISHKYLISKTILSADCVINLPKLKTHRKAGMTGALKNLIGINCLKDYLPHHTKGPASSGGDEYLHHHVLTALQSRLYDMRNSLRNTQHHSLRLITRAMRINRRLIRLTGTRDYFEGSWYGNDTIWRTVLDLNRILVYADRDGIMRQSPQRRFFVCVDAVVAGEKEGPLEPVSKPCGALFAGYNPVAVDVACAHFMGFDPLAFPQLHKAFALQKYRLAHFGMHDILARVNGVAVKIGDNGSLTSSFEPPEGWAPVLRAERSRKL